jgi:hypothetical protein
MPRDLLVWPVRPIERIENGWLGRDRDPEFLPSRRPGRDQCRGEDNKPK